MNENSSNSTSLPHHGLTAEAVSRRAYELWEQEGRPESRDLHHWLRAEQQLLAEQNRSNGAGSSNASSARPANTDTQPLQGTRAGAAMNRDASTNAKRSGTTGPFNGEKRATTRSPQGAGRSSGK
jgi:hypothetical protein